MTKRSDDDELIGASTASHILETSTQSVRNWAKSGLLSFQVLDGGRVMLFKRRDVERYAAERRKGPQSTKARRL